MYFSRNSTLSLFSPLILPIVNLRKLMDTHLWTPLHSISFKSGHKSRTHVVSTRGKLASHCLRHGVVCPSKVIPVGSTASPSTKPSELLLEFPRTNTIRVHVIAMQNNGDVCQPSLAWNTTESDHFEILMKFYNLKSFNSYIITRRRYHLSYYLIHLEVSIRYQWFLNYKALTGFWFKTYAAKFKIKWSDSIIVFKFN